MLSGVTLTVKELYIELVNHLAQAEVYIGHGTVDAEDEVLLLLMYVLEIDFDVLNRQVLLPVSNQQQALAKQLLEKRIKDNKPMAYVVGFSVFAGLEFVVDERVLVPRSPFVQLIDQAFQPWLDIEQTTRVLDLCTGSGCIGLAVAHYFEHLNVTLSDLSQEALIVAAINRDKLGLQYRTQLMTSDLFENITGQFDLIITNPPYVSEEEYQNLPDEFSHEPKMALVSDRKGLEIPVRILSEAANYLSDQGVLFLEVGFYDQKLDVVFPEVPFIWLDFDFSEHELGDGQGICVFSRADLLEFKPHFDAFLNHVS